MNVWKFSWMMCWWNECKTQCIWQYSRPQWISDSRIFVIIFILPFTFIHIKLTEHHFAVFDFSFVIIIIRVLFDTFYKHRIQYQLVLFSFFEKRKLGNVRFCAFDKIFSFLLSSLWNMRHRERAYCPSIWQSTKLWLMED